MYWSVSKIQKTGAVFMIFLSWVIALHDVEDDKTLNLRIGFDLTRGKNGAPSLRIRNFEEVPELNKQKNNKEMKKQSLRTQFSSESDEKVDDKIIIVPKIKKESDESDDVDTSGSDDNRRLSTKGISPDEYEPESNLRVHKQNSKESESE